MTYDKSDKLLRYILKKYTLNDFPCLYNQYKRYVENRPFEGLKILNSTPIFYNTLAKILPIVASGAKLSLRVPTFINSCTDTIKILKELDIKIIKHEPKDYEFDVILDCVGENVNVATNLGNAELTKSGIEKYRKSNSYFVNIDDSDCKYIEDYYGTAESLLRALEKINIDIQNKNIIIFGYGKVGSGIADLLASSGGNVFVVEKNQKIVNEIKHESILFTEHDKIYNFLSNADIVITATGVKDVISSNYKYEKFCRDRLILINMGAEDEFGRSFSGPEILNNKMPLNFILNEPTRLKFLDPTFALQNEAINFLKRHSRKDEERELRVPVHIESDIINIFKEAYKI